MEHYDYLGIKQPTYFVMEEDNNKRPNKKIKTEENEDWNSILDNNFSANLTKSYIDLIITDNNNNNNISPNFQHINQNNINNNNSNGFDNFEFIENNFGNEYDQQLRTNNQINEEEINIEINEPILMKIRNEMNLVETIIEEIYDQCRKNIYPKKEALNEKKMVINNLIKQIHELLEKKILHVAYIYYSYWMLQQLHLFLKRIILVENEIEFYEEKMSKIEAADILTSFIFIDQPLSQSFKNKNRARQVNAKKKLHCNMKAAILTSPNCYFRATKSIMAVFATKEDSSSKPDITLECTTNEIDKSYTVLSFGFRFPVGTRCKPAQLRLEVEGEIFIPNNNKFTFLLKSESSNHYVVATNECQWEGAEGKLLLFDVFGEENITTSQKGNKRKKKKNAKEEKEATWEFFINQLSIRFIRATRQEVPFEEIIKKIENLEISSIFKRILNDLDISYLHEKRFENRKSVSLEKVDVFWEWYGKTLHIFRHNSHIRLIFLEGLFFSLISKDKSNELLKNQRPGTFLIRTSERSTKGEFALAFVTEDHKIKHTKIESQKIQPPHNNLPDYIKEKHQLTSVIKPPFLGTTQYQLLEKDNAFGKFYMKKQKDKDDSYEEIDD